MEVIVRRARTLLIYVIVFHVIRVLSDVMLPNAHVFNVVRGFLLGMFFASRSKGLAIASGITVLGAWNLRVESNVYLAHHCWLNASGGLTIGEGAIVSPNVVIATTAHERVNSAVSLDQSRHAPIVIGRGVWIASNCVITRGSSIGDGAVIAAGSVVYGHVPPNTLYRGNPAAWVKDLP